MQKKAVTAPKTGPRKAEGRGARAPNAPLPAALTALPSANPFDSAWSRTLSLRYGLTARMQAAFLFSLVLHLFSIIAVGFKVPDASAYSAPHNVLEVVLVNARTQRAPDKADALAQANLDGGGNTDRKVRASTPLPNVEQRAADRELAEAQTRVTQLEREVQRFLTASQSPRKQQQTEAPVVEGGRVTPAESDENPNKSIEIARLEAQIKEQYRQYQERPKRQFVGARVREYRFAQYVDAWRLKIERVGNLNYPEEARRRGTYGQLQLTVAIKATGEVEGIEINTPSEHRFLNDAARRIVMLAAPFEPFPAAIRRDTDVLHITRTWQFTRDDLLRAEEPIQ
jgi:protein TonB